MKPALWSKIFGVFFLVIGIGGFIPFLAPNNDHGQLLLGIFQVNPAQSVIHILSGLVALAAMRSDAYARSYFKVFGAVYALVAIWGLPAFGGNYDGVLFGLLHVNLATELLHIAIAAISLYIAFGPKTAKA